MSALRTTVVAVATTLAARAALDAAPPLGRERWERRNHSGGTVTLLEGPAVVAGMTLASALAGPHAFAGTVAALGAGALGALDDHVGATDVKGLRGHLGALREGRVTTGAVKIAGLAATGLAAAALVDRPRTPTAWAGTLVGGVVVAGAANVINLLDLRPGRALKASLLAAAPALGGASGPLAGALVGASAAALPDDLGRRSMLGDTGANALGALAGTAWVTRLGLPGRVVAAAGLASLVLASERVSFTKVIESTPVLRELDALGRRPA